MTRCLLVLDSNEVQGRALLTLSQSVSRVNVGRDAEARVVLALPSLVHAERLYQLRRARPDDFSMTVLRRMLAPVFEAGLRILPYTEEDAEAHGRLLAGPYPTDGAWRAARRGAAPAVGGRGATVDWFIATQAMARCAILVTSDKGVEFGWMDTEARVTATELRAALQALLG